MSRVKPSSQQRREAPPHSAEGENAREPLRQCIVTRERYPKEVMVRFVAAPDGTLTPDLQAKLPGRGAWVIADAPAIEKAIQKHMFGRALDVQISVPKELCGRIEALLARRCLELIGPGARCGAMLLGSGSAGARPARAGEEWRYRSRRRRRRTGRRKVLACAQGGRPYKRAGA